MIIKSPWNVNLNQEKCKEEYGYQERLKKGHIIKEENITYKRPGTGISPLHWDEVIEGSWKVDLSADHILDWSDFI